MFLIWKCPTYCTLELNVMEINFVNVTEWKVQKDISSMKEIIRKLIVLVDNKSAEEIQ